MFRTIRKTLNYLQENIVMTLLTEATMRIAAGLSFVE